MIFSFKNSVPCMLSAVLFVGCGTESTHDVDLHIAPASEDSGLEPVDAASDEEDVVDLKPQAEVEPTVQVLDSAVVGGENASISDFPWQAAMQSTSGRLHCGASILTPSWLLTAQHCVKTGTRYVIRPPALWKIAVGSASWSGLSTAGQVRIIDDIIPYPGYSDASVGKDVALIHLATPLTLNANVQPIPLVTAADERAGLTNAGVVATLTGWGLMSSNGTQQASTLQRADIPIVSFAEANAAYDGELTTDQLAAGFINGGGEDSCSGDSGGPVVVTKGSSKVLAGVVSWATGCGEPGYPGMNAKVSAFASWISGIITGGVTTLGVGRGIAITGGYWKHYVLTVPAGLPVLNVHLSGGSGDGDLYVRYGARPTASQYTCRPYMTTSYESCSIPAPSAGKWYVSINAASAVSGASVRATTY